jgi:hypothetical protein
MPIRRIGLMPILLIGFVFKDEQLRNFLRFAVYSHMTSIYAISPRVPFEAPICSPSQEALLHRFYQQFYAFSKSSRFFIQ